MCDLRLAFSMMFFFARLFVRGLVEGPRGVGALWWVEGGVSLQGNRVSRSMGEIWSSGPGFCVAGEGTQLLYWRGWRGDMVWYAVVVRGREGWGMLIWKVYEAWCLKTRSIFMYFE